MSKLLDRIQPVSIRPPNFKFLLFGPPGSGKTVFAAGARNPLLLDVEDGALSLLNHPELATTPRLSIADQDELEDFIFECRDHPEDYEQFDTILVDTVSELQDRALTNILRRKSALDDKRNKYAAQQLDYKENSEHLRRVFIALNDLGKDIIYLAHVAEIKDENSGKLWVRPSLSPKLAGTMRGLVDIQGYLTASYDKSSGEIVRQLQLIEVGTIQAKTRVGGLPPIMENPCFDDILKAHLANLERANGTGP